MTTIQRHMRAPMNPSAHLFSPQAVVWHTILLTPIVGACLVAMNWSRLGDRRRSATSVAVGLGALIIITAFGALISPQASVAGLVGGTVALSIGWYQEQKIVFNTHMLVGGDQAPSWPMSIAGVVFLSILAVGYLTSGLPLPF